MGSNRPMTWNGENSQLELDKVRNQSMDFGEEFDVAAENERKLPGRF